MVGKDPIKWTIYYDKGHTITMTVKGFYVPGSKVRLLSAQSYISQHGGSFHLEVDEAIFFFANGSCLTFQTYYTLTGNSLFMLAYLTQAKDFLSQGESKEIIFTSFLIQI